MTTTDQTLNLTASKLEEWLHGCRQKWAYIHVEGKRRPPAAALAFGKGWDRFQTAKRGAEKPYAEPGEATHETLDGYYAAKLKDGKDLPLKEAQDLFVETFRQEAERVENWENDETSDALLMTGLRGIAGWMKDVGQVIQPVALQQSWQLAMRSQDGRDWSISGTVDLAAIDERSGPKPFLRDAKTSGKAWPERKARTNLQTFHYSVAAAHHPVFVQLGLDPDKMAYDVLVKTKVPQHQRIEVTIDGAARTRYLTIIEDARAEIARSQELNFFRPNRQSFLCSRRWCPFWKECEDKWGPGVPE